MATLPTYDYEAEQQDILRRQKIAEAMMTGGLAPMGPTETIGGYAVKRSPLEAVGKVLQAYIGNRGMQGAGDEQKKLSERYRGDIRTGLEKFFTTMEGGMQQGPADWYDGEPSQIQVAANPRRAVIEAMASNNPALQQIGQAYMAQMQKGQLTPEVLSHLATPESVLRNPTNTTAWQPKRELKGIAPGEVLLDAGGNIATPGGSGGAPGATPGPEGTPDMPAGTGWKTIKIGGDLYQVTATGLKKLDNAPKISLQNHSTVLNAGQKAGVQEYFKKAAEWVDALGKTANSSGQLLSTLNQLEQLAAGGINSGLTAQGATALQNLGQVLGVPVDKTKLANTETYNSLITDLWQRAVSQFGGNRGVTQAEAEEIKRLTPLATNSPQARQQIIAIQKAVAQRNIAGYKAANASFAKAAAADDPTLFQIPGEMEGVYSPAPTNNAPATVTPGGGGGPLSLDDYLKSKGVR